MFADEEMEQDDSSEQPTEEPEQDDSSEQPAEELESSADDAWKTAPEMKKVDKKAVEEAPKAGRQGTVVASTTGETEKATPEPTAEAAPASTESDGSSEKFPGSLLSSIGIEDPNTQKWVLIGAIVLIVLCCSCVCCAVIATAASSGTADFNF